jgi:hypothetical protein
MMLAGLDVENAPVVAPAPPGDDRDLDGRLEWHVAAIPNTCGRCGRGIVAGQRQTVLGGVVVDDCADDEE